MTQEVQSSAFNSSFYYVAMKDEDPPATGKLISGRVMRLGALDDSANNAT